jgi:heterodisulfide reductase subunit A
MTAEETIVPEDHEEEAIESPVEEQAPDTEEPRVGPVGSALVIGAGIAGMQTALDMADTNLLVHVVEDQPGIGGWMSKLDKTFPTNDCAMCTLAPKLVEVGRHPNIVLHTNARVTALDGEAGEFSAKIVERPRFIDPDKCTGCGFCGQYCPVEAISEYDEAVGDRPAVNVLFPQTVPLLYSIDRESCIGCGLCEEVCPAHAVDYMQEPVTVEADVGAVVLAAGYAEIPASTRPEYGWGRYPNVITAPQFERVLSASGPFGGEVLRASDGKHPKKIAWLQCVGSRDPHHGRPFCSSVCCTYATKEAIIAKEHLGREDVDCHIFFMDMRTYGKAFEEYYNRAKDEYKVKYTRCRIGEVREDPQTRDLIINYEDEEGNAKAETFDMVVLSTGLDPPDNSEELAETFDIELDELGYAKTSIFSPVDTTRQGVYVCGALEGPKDIPDTVAQASAAAARAEAIVAPSRGTETTPVELPEEIDVLVEDVKIGVFVCHCGINIGGVVDVPDVVEYAKNLPDVVHAEHNLYTCSQDTQDNIKEKIRELGLNRVVVASCTPRTHEPLFQNTISEAALNPHLFDLASLREHVSWVHQMDHDAATRKAKRLVAMSVDKVRHSVPVHKEPSAVEPTGLIVGGGPAGIAAALALADQGLRAFLVERQDQLGGNLRRLPHLMEDEDPKEAMEQMISRIQADEDVEVLLSSELVDLSGVIGNFEATIRTPEGDRTIPVGAIIVATGAYELEPEGEYMFGQDDRVMTAIQAGEAIDRGEFPKEGPVAFVHCVGSRIPEREYCSRVCCSTALKNAIHIKEMSPETDVIMFYRDLRTYGHRELAYRRAREMGIQFVRFDTDRPPVITKEGKDLALEWVDKVGRKRVKRRMGTVVLAAATLPYEDSHELGSLLKVPLTEHGYFLEAHMKIRPLDFATDGVFLAGSCHGPKFLNEAIAQAIGAASRAATILANPTVVPEGLPSWVDTARCTGCGTCEENCAYNAITVDEDQGVATVNTVLCKGCGTCATVCPSGAPVSPKFEKDQIINMIEDALLPARGGA